LSEADVLKAPFPAFGGKSRVADLVWDRLGDVSNYIEPFFNSGAVLLRRPHPPRIETVNDINSYVANFWRAVKCDPAAVASHADHPVIEVDLHARHRWLVLSAESAEFRRRLREDPDYFDAKVAGWWCWGACCWIGSGWCEERGPASEQLPMLTGGYSYGGRGVHADKIAGKRPKLSGGSPDSGALGAGVHANGPALSQQLPDITSGRTVRFGRGVIGSHEGHRPQLADAYARGRGVHGNDSAGTCAARRDWLLDWFGRLADRLRVVRVCCGDWKRVCSSPSVTTRLGTTGLFLDPPYPTHSTDGSSSRAAGLYGADDSRAVLDGLRDDVLAYCLDRGPDPLMRLAVCGLVGDGYEALEAAGWECVPWKAAGGYNNRTAAGKANAARERIWFSPHCLRPGRGQATLFDHLEAS
jgi:DNA adenine methylase